MDKQQSLPYGSFFSRGRRGNKQKNLLKEAIPSARGRGNDGGTGRLLEGGRISARP
jgi:hypothetical protein